MCPLLPVSLDCPLLIAPSVFFNLRLIISNWSIFLFWHFTDMWRTLIRTHRFTKRESFIIQIYFNLVTANCLYQVRGERERERERESEQSFVNRVSILFVSIFLLDSPGLVFIELLLLVDNCAYSVQL